MIKLNYPLALFLLLISQGVLATENDEDLSSDFLEFIADMDEITGDGFESWLESNTTEQEITENEDVTTSQ